MAELGLGVDGEDDRRHPALAVVRGDAVEVGPRAVGAEVSARRLDEVVRQGVVPVVVDLDVHVHVDRLDGVEVDRGFVAGHCGPERCRRVRRCGAGRWRSSGSGGNFSPTDCS